jgi:hypothetical protein
MMSFVLPRGVRKGATQAIAAPRGRGLLSGVRDPQDPAGLIGIKQVRARRRFVLPIVKPDLPLFEVNVPIE